MIRAYDELYVGKAQIALGDMLDTGVNSFGMDCSAFFDCFIACGLARRFGEGDPALTVGKSGIELAFDVLVQSGLDAPDCVRPKYPMEKSPEYWAGWALAYFQWESALPFASISTAVPLDEIVAMYPVYHEMDLSQFCLEMSRRFLLANPSTHLQRIRKEAGMSQQQLAEQSGIPKRTIQQYEQRQKDINKAAFETVLALSSALCCDPRALAERIDYAIVEF